MTAKKPMKLSIPDMPKLGFYSGEELKDLVFELDGRRLYDAKMDLYLRDLFTAIKEAGIEVNFPERPTPNE